MNKELPIIYLAGTVRPRGASPGSTPGCPTCPWPRMANAMHESWVTGSKDWLLRKYSPVRCNVPTGPASWPGSVLWLKWIRISSSGITANTRDGPAPKLPRSDQTGNCFWMAVRGESRCNKSLIVPIGWWAGCTAYRHGRIQIIKWKTEGLLRATPFTTKWMFTNNSQTIRYHRKLKTNTW